MSKAETKIGNNKDLEYKKGFVIFQGRRGNIWKGGI